MKTIRQQFLSLSLAALLLTGFSTIKAQDVTPAAVNTNTIKIVLDRTKDVYGMNNAVIIKHLELKVNSGRTFDKYKPEMKEAQLILTKFASSTYEFRTRILAFNSLKATNTCNESVVQNLFQAMLSSNGRLA